MLKLAAMKTVSRKLIFLFWLMPFMLAGSTVSAQQERQLGSITYRLSMTRPQSHLFEVAIEIELPENVPESLDFQMAKWSPGRYAVFDFAKNVQEVRAATGICPPMTGCDKGRPVTRVDDQTWLAPPRNGRAAMITRE